MAENSLTSAPAQPDNVIPFEKKGDSQSPEQKSTIACPYCGDAMQIPSKPLEHLIITLDDSNKIHVHGCIHNPMVTAKMVAAVTFETAKFAAEHPPERRFY